MSDIDQKDSTTPADLPTDLVCDLLANEERRHLLLVLQDCDQPTTVKRLARLLSAEISSADLDAVESLHINLHHIHLPMLAEAEMITRTEGDERVQLTEWGDALVEALFESP